MLISSLNNFFILYNEIALENDNLKKQNQNNSVITATNCYSYGCFIMIK